MTAPLSEFRRLTTKDFFTDIEARRHEFCALIGENYDFYEEKTIKGKKGVYFYDVDYSKTLFLKNSDLYIVQYYDVIEGREKQSLRKKVYTELDTSKTEIFIGYVIKELTHILETVKTFELNKRLQSCKVAIIAKLQDFIAYLEDSFLNVEQLEKREDKIPKIRWLGETKMLTTLFLDLLNGQKKTTKGEKSTKPIMKARLIDIKKMLLENFIDKEGNPLKPSTIKSYLISNKPNSKTLEGGRIELRYD